MDKKTDQLLHEIREIVLCPYLSDLHNARLDERAKVMISKIPEGRYTIVNWNEAVSYIAGTVCNCRSVREAKQKLSR